MKLISPTVKGRLWERKKALVSKLFFIAAKIPGKKRKLTTRKNR